MNLKRLALIWTAAMLLTGTAAWAGDIDFTCSLNRSDHCRGSITQAGSNYSTTGITVFNDSGPYKPSVPFELIFNTATGTISLDGTKKGKKNYTGQDLMGDITSFTVTQGQTVTDFSFTADWLTLPPLVQADLHSHEGLDSGSLITLNITHPKKGKAHDGNAESADVVITTPTPEPSSLALFGSGLVTIGGLLRRKLRPI